MNEDQETLSLFDNSRKAEQVIIKLLRMIGVNPKAKNALVNAENKLIAEREKYEEQLEIEKRRQEDICRMVNAKDYTAAKKKIVSVFNKYGLSRKVSERYGLNTTYQEGVGRKWDKNGGDSSDALTILQNINKKINHQKSLYSETYEKFLVRVELACQDSGFDEETTRSEIVRWHTAMEEDFDLLTVVEFWQKYEGDLLDISVMPEEPQSVLLHEALPLIKKYAPIQVYQELYNDDPDRLGYITRNRFNKWNDRVTALKQMSGDALNMEKYTLTAEILSEAVYRRIEGPKAILTPGEKETALRYILTDEKINPYNKEFSVDDNTSFLEIQQLYSEYSGAEK